MSDPMKEAVDEVVRLTGRLSVLEKKVVLALYDSVALTRFKLYRVITVCGREPQILDFEVAMTHLERLGIVVENIISKHCYLTRPLGYLVAGNIKSAPKLTVITTTGQ